MKKKATFVGVIGHIETNWIEKQIKLENNIAFAKSVHYVPQASPALKALELTPVAAHVFGRSITRFFSSLIA
jgi:hypothetical protein